MFKKKEEKQTVFATDDGRAVIAAWLADTQKGDSSPAEYLTKCGQAYLNGFLQSNNTMQLIKIEEYNKLRDDYADLIEKYEKEGTLRSQIQAALELATKQNPWWKFWIK